MERQRQGVLPGQDCYFYYYSTCTRQDDCPFRHEPLALSNETVCIYWKEGKCTKDHCIYRHMDLGGRKRNVTQCYWEKQPQGCTKPHCAFLHQQPKDPITQALPTNEPGQSPSTRKIQMDAGSIIVNPAKLEKVQEILDVKTVERDEESGVRRLLVPAGAGALARKTVTGGIKARLGHSGGVKARLGLGLPVSTEMDSEEEDLRKSAIKTLDLRSRIDGKIIINRKVIETDSGDTGDIEEAEDDTGIKLKRSDIILLREKKIEKMKEKLRKDKIILRAEKKARKQDKLKSRVAAVIDHVSLSRREIEDLPSASDYSDLDSPDEDAAVLSVISRTDKAGMMRSDVHREKLSAKTRLGRSRGVLDSLDNGESGDLRKRMKERREKIEKQNYAARVLGDMMGGKETTKLGKRSIDRLDLSDEEIKTPKKKNRDQSTKSKKKKKSERKEKKSKRSRKSESKERPSEEKNALEMAQEFSKEYEPIKARKMKISTGAGGTSDLNTSLTLDTSQDDNQDYGVNVKISGDVMKDLDEFLND